MLRHTRLRLRRPSPALVIACLALVVALGGTGYAAITLPKNSVGPKQLKKHAVTPAKVSAKTVHLFRGQTGPQGVPGTARAYAKVDYSSTKLVLDRQASKNFTGMRPMFTGADGQYCLKLAPGIDPAKSAPVASAFWTSGYANTFYVAEIDSNECEAGEIGVVTITAGSGKPTNDPFFVVVP